MEQNIDKICAIICEYNPMHTGHVYLINKAKELTGCKSVIGLMSGNFSQRSEPCVLDKYTRAQIAVKNGLDLVLNFPTVFCINNAEIFALSAIKILNQFNISYLAFGVETLNEQAFYALANFLINEPKNFKVELKQNLKNGEGYSNALKTTIENFINHFDETLQQDILKILSHPNNVLGLEYFKALLKTKSKIKPILVKRVDNFNNNNIINNFASSSFIRQNLEENFNQVKKYLPQNSIEYFNYNVNLNLFNDILLFNLKTINLAHLKKIYGINEGLENRLKILAESNSNFNDFYLKLKTKRYKNSRIKSILLNSLFDIKTKFIKKIYTIKNNIYIKILAKNPKNATIFNKIDTKNLIIRKQDMQKIKLNKFNKKIMDVENKANSLYNLISKTSLIENDYYNKMK